MSRIIDQLVYKISADTAGAEKGLDTTGKKFDAVAKSHRLQWEPLLLGVLSRL